VAGDHGAGVTVDAAPARMRPPLIPSDIEEYRDRRWRREDARRVETALDAERFVDQVGFAACLTDARRSGPSLYVAVCGRRDAVLPRRVRKDPETSLTWELKDELVRRQGLLPQARPRQSDVSSPAPDPALPCVWGLRRSEERSQTGSRVRVRVPTGVWRAARQGPWRNKPQRVRSFPVRARD
jgi:hypothetical protein